MDAIVKDFVTDTDEESKPLYTTLAQVESELTSLEYTATDKKEIISAWQKRNVDESLSDIKNAKFENGQLIIDGEPMSAEDVYNGVKSGLFGDSADDVLKMYINKVISAAGSSTATLADTIFAREQIGYLGNELYKDRGDADELTRFVGGQSKKIKDVFSVRDARSIREYGDTIISGVEFNGTAPKVTDSTTLSQLKSFGVTSDSMVFMDGHYYLYDHRSRNWYKYTLAKK